MNIFIDYDENVIDERNFKNRQFTPEQRRQVGSRNLSGLYKIQLTEGNNPNPNYIIQTKIT